MLALSNLASSLPFCLNSNFVICSDIANYWKWKDHKTTVCHSWAKLVSKIFRESVRAILDTCVTHWGHKQFLFTFGPSLCYLLPECRVHNRIATSQGSHLLPKESSLHFSPILQFMSSTSKKKKKFCQILLALQGLKSWKFSPHWDETCFLWRNEIVGVDLWCTRVPNGVLFCCFILFIYFFTFVFTFRKQMWHWQTADITKGSIPSRSKCNPRLPRQGH